MNLKKTAAITLGKTIHKTTQVLKIGGGSAAPGYYALKLYPNLVAELGRQIPKTVVITGTNGKTTTSRMLAQFAGAQGIKVIRNETGSNLERGIASSLIHNSKFIIHNSVDLAIWELDEAAFNIVVPKINPDIIVFLNVFRDQLDRYGEVDTIVKKWGKTLSQVNPSVKIFLNGDDENLLELQKSFKGEVKTFGVTDYKIAGEKRAQLRKKNDLDLEATNIQPQGLDITKFKVKNQNFTLPLPGTYHIYDFLAAFAVASELGVSLGNIKSGLESFSPAFGRVEKLNLKDNKEGYIFLIKNPTGATQVIRTIQDQIKPEDRLLLALNDNLADGTDVSWIWDTNFEDLGFRNIDLRIICSGIRAEDLALRLKYAGFDPKTLETEKDLQVAFHASVKGLEGRLFILPTYTALLKLQSILAKSGIKQYYWKEEK